MKPSKRCVSIFTRDSLLKSFQKKMSFIGGAEAPDLDVNNPEELARWQLGHSAYCCVLPTEDLERKTVPKFNSTLNFKKM